MPCNLNYVDQKVVTNEECDSSSTVRYFLGALKTSHLNIVLVV